MARGLFELRKDSVTGWWVAVVVDREFDRERFHRPAKHIGHGVDSLPQLLRAAGTDGVRVRMLKQDAFIVAGTEREQREAEPEGREPALGLVGDTGSWQTIVAPRGHHESFAETSPQIAFELLARARDVLTDARNAEKTDYLQVVQNYGRQAGALTDHLCFDFYDLPHIPHRIGEELGGAARYVIREGICPFAVSCATRWPNRRGSCSRTLPASPLRRTRHAPRSSCGSCRATTTPISVLPRMRSW